MHHDDKLVQYKHREPSSEDPEPKIDFKKAAECSLPPIDSEKQLQNVMDAILPPRKFEIDGKFWIERVSTVPSTRLDLLALQEKFENCLKLNGAKPFGVCPIRRRIYDQLFDELIRQVTVNCAERGLLLLRVRDEIKLTMLSYQSLIESAIAYGIRKALLAERQQSGAVVELEDEKKKNEELAKKVRELERQLAQEKDLKENEMKLLEQGLRDENERLREANKTLKTQLQAIIQMEQQLQQEEAKLNEDA